ncbi:hypothetical protein [Pelosinus sp. IPA-1]|uniref:hypothetical protein n=1 Tax=Pelosinus sp. IPA-1 TaxID=3029569 RepID=UPI002436232D|nr:hypothetical protein [Pelosinus sp. IPA-1]GMA99996.1 hypothetical protein PIPA1_27960 [Pelosinus sp. IPA-1]
MLNIIRKLFSIMESVVEWFNKMSIFNIKLYYLLLIIMVILSISVSHIFRLNSLMIGITGTYFWFLMLLQYLTKKGPKRDDKAGLELVKEFSHRSFLTGLYKFSFELMSLIFVILICFVYTLTGEFNYSVKIIFYYIIEIFLCILAIFIVLWFSYHVVINDKVTPKTAKALLTFYLWISTTVTSLLYFANNYSKIDIIDIIKVIISALGISFALVNHIISLREYELEIEEKDKKDKKKQEELVLQFWQETTYDLLMKKRD